MRGSIVALALQRYRPDIAFLLFDEADCFGGRATDIVSLSGLNDRWLALIDPAIIYEWRSYYIGGYGHSKLIQGAGAIIQPAQLHGEILACIPPERLRPRCPVIARTDTSVQTPHGSCHARLILDLRPERASPDVPVMRVATADYDGSLPAGFTTPILFDPPSKRNMPPTIWQYFPVSERRMIVRELNLIGTMPTARGDFGALPQLTLPVQDLPFEHRVAGSFIPNNPLLPSSLDAAIFLAESIMTLSSLTPEALAQSVKKNAAIVQARLTRRQRLLALLKDSDLERSQRVMARYAHTV